MSNLTKFETQWRRINAVHKAMHDAADGGVWRGHTTKLFTELGISSPYYGETMFILSELGCVEKIKRGSGGSLSEWLILPQPDKDQFTAFMYENYKPKERKPPAIRRVNLLEKRVANLEEYMRRLLGGEFNAVTEEAESEGEEASAEKAEAESDTGWHQTTVDEQINSSIKASGN